MAFDGDLVVYRFASSCQMDIDWGDGTSNSYGDLRRACKEVDGFISSHVKGAECDAYKVYISAPAETQFRRKLNPSYKHNRKGVAKPGLYYDLLQHTMDAHPSFTLSQLEADDYLGLVCSPQGLTDEYILASIDKDLNQIACEHYDWRSSLLYYVSEEEGDMFFYLQILTGDSTDGYSGCPGIGPVKAHRLLYDTAEEDRWPIIVEAYEAKGLTEADALLQARMARILRHGDYDFQRKEVKLWTPIS